MTKRLGLIVTDASPLITLGAARALSCLTMPGRAAPKYLATRLPRLDARSVQ